MKRFVCTPESSMFDRFLNATICLNIAGCNDLFANQKAASFTAFWMQRFVCTPENSYFHYFLNAAIFLHTRKQHVWPLSECNNLFEHCWMQRFVCTPESTRKQQFSLLSECNDLFANQKVAIFTAFWMQQFIFIAEGSKIWPLSDYNDFLFTSECSIFHCFLKVTI